MNIVSHKQAGALDITLQGSFTFDDHNGFRDILTAMASSDIVRVVFHMASVTFIDSSALGMLLLARDEAEKHKKSIALVGAAGQVDKLLRMARFDQLFTMTA